MSTGVNFSLNGLQNVCATGIPSFDHLIGGGFALTSLNLIEEDAFQMYSSMLVKAYLSSSIYSKQNVIVFSPSICNEKSRFIRELPSLQKCESLGDFEKESIKIAFRYSETPSSLESKETEKLDFGNHVDSNLLEQSSFEFYNHQDIISVLQSKIKVSSSNENVCRILIHELASPISSLSSENLPKLLHQVKVLMRRLLNSVCLVTLVSLDCELEAFESVRNQLHFNSDCSIKCVAFDEDSEITNPYSNDYVGIIHLTHLPRLNSFGPYNQSLETTEYGIKLNLGKRYLTVEKLALPPDLGEMVNRFTHSTNISDSISSCGIGSKKESLDF